jgi:3-oxoacyl-[acyl-carrier protein] reductase
MARAAGPYNVHVNCVTPGAIQTESEVRFVNDEDVRRMVASQCLARRITPLDVARVCLFLSCELSDGMTGQCLNVDGGWVMH